MRAIPLGGLDLASLSGSNASNPAIANPWGHWEHLAECFVEPVAAGYVNVVCCPPGTMYGAKKTVKEISGGMSNSDEVATSAGLAICELFTPSVSNVLITSATPKPTFDELVAMKHYRTVVVHDMGDVERLKELGVSSFYLPPNDLIETFPMFLADEALTS